MLSYVTTCTYILLKKSLQGLYYYPALIYYHMDHSSLFPLLICKLLLQIITLCPLFTVHLLICSFSVHMDRSISIVNNTPRVTTLSATIQCVCTVSFIFSFTDSTHFPNYIFLHLFTHSLHSDCFIHL